jgi:hypothetical protein
VGGHANSLSGVADTIFPQSTLQRHGPVDFYQMYRERLLPRMKKMTRDWGRYFDRLAEWPKVLACIAHTGDRRRAEKRSVFRQLSITDAVFCPR